MELCIFKAVLNHEVAHPALPRNQVSTIFSQVKKLRYSVQQLTQHIQLGQEHRLPDFHPDIVNQAAFFPERENVGIQQLLYFYMLTRLKLCCCRPRSLKVIAHQRVEFEACDYSSACLPFRCSLLGIWQPKQLLASEEAGILGVSCLTLQNSFTNSEAGFFTLKMKTVFFDSFLLKHTKQLNHP